MCEQVVSSLQHQALAQEPPHTVNSPSPAATPDPVVRKQAVQDLMAQMQGTYNFMQVRGPLLLPFNVIRLSKYLLLFESSEVPALKSYFGVAD